MPISTSQAAQPAHAVGTWQRRRDNLYVAFLFLVVLLAFVVDFVPHSPLSLPPWATAVYGYYRRTCNDPLYAKDPPFFQLYIVIEAVYAVPASLWSMRGLIRGDKKASVHLLVLSTHLVISTLVCLVEVLGTRDWPREDINRNIPGYIVFFIISITMWLDMYSRVMKGLTEKRKVN